MAGVPLLNGFLSKEMFFAEALESNARPVMGWLLPVGATLAGVFSVAYSTRFIHDVFFNGEPVGLPKTPHEPPRFMRVPVEVLALACLAVGIAPGLTVGPILAAGAGAALGAPLPAYSLAVWHGFNTPLVMSFIALAGGVALYFGLQRFINLHRIVQVPRGGREAFMFVLARTVKSARDLTLGLQNGSLQRYLLLLVVMALTAGLLPFLLGAAFRATPGPSTAPSPAFIAAVVRRHRSGPRDAGRVPAPPARPDGPRRRRTRRRAGVRVPVGPGPRADAVAGRGGHRHPDDARAELAAAGEPARTIGGAASAARDRRLRGGPGRDGRGLAGADAALRLDLAVLPADCAFRWEAVRTPST